MAKRRKGADQTINVISDVEEEETALLHTSHITQRMPAVTRAARTNSIQLCADVGVLLNTVRLPGANGNNCGFLALGSCLGETEQSVRDRLVSATPPPRRQELAQRSTWLTWDDLNQLAKFEEDFQVISLLSLQHNGNAELAGRLATKSTEILLSNKEHIYQCLADNQNAILLYCEGNRHWMPCARAQVGHTSARQTATFVEPSNSEREAVGGQEEQKAVGGQGELKDTCWQTIRTRAAHYFPDRPLTESEIQRDRKRERWV